MTGSQWDYADAFAHVAKQANQRIGNHPDTMLAIDESGFTKKGNCSAAVARQYNGRMGKVDNCQVGVFTRLVFSREPLARIHYQASRKEAPEAKGSIKNKNRDISQQRENIKIQNLTE